jgi:hypothetical protein
MTFRTPALLCAAIALAPVATAADAVLRADQTTAQFQQLWNNFFAKDGNKLVSFDGYMTPSGIRYVAHGVKAPHPALMAYAEMSVGDFQKMFDKAAKDQMGLVDITVSDTPSGTVFGGIWVAGEQTGALGELSQGDLNTWQVNAAQSGSVPIDLDCYGTNADRKYAVIWKNDPAAGPFKMEYGLSAEGFQERFNLHVDEGYRLVQADTCAAAGEEPRFGGIFIKTDGRNWYSKGNLTRTDLGKEQSNAESQGYTLLSVTGYTSSGGESLFGAIWAMEP